MLAGDLLVAAVAEVEAGSVLLRRYSCVILECRSHSCPFFSADIVVWYFLVEMLCHVVYFGSICRNPNSVPFFSFRFGR